MSKYDITCQECDTNFEVYSDAKDNVDFCPFCGENIYPEPDGWEEDEDEED